jgi:hypothetical protein
MVRRLVTLLSLSLMFCLPPSIAGESTVTAATPEMVRNDTALSMITFPWHDIGYDIVFMPPMTGYRAMTYPKQHRIEIYARPNDDAKRLAHDIAHELGHAIDVTYNTAESRKEWMEYRNIDPSKSWFTCNKCSDFESPAGDFAETFALLQVGPDYFSGRVAPKPLSKDIPTLNAFITKISKKP